MDFCHALLGVVGEQKSGDFGSAASIDSAFDTVGKNADESIDGM